MSTASALVCVPVGRSSSRTKTPYISSSSRMSTAGFKADETQPTLPFGQVLLFSLSLYRPSVVAGSRTCTHIYIRIHTPASSLPVVVVVPFQFVRTSLCPLLSWLKTLSFFPSFPSLTIVYRGEREQLAQAQLSFAALHHP